MGFTDKGITALFIDMRKQCIDLTSTGRGYMRAKGQYKGWLPTRQKIQLMRSVTQP